MAYTIGVGTNKKENPLDMYLQISGAPQKNYEKGIAQNNASKSMAALNSTLKPYTEEINKATKVYDYFNSGGGLLSGNAGTPWYIGTLPEVTQPKKTDGGGGGKAAAPRVNPYESAAAEAAAGLAKWEAAKPGAYQSSYQSQIDSLLNGILNREKFSYNMEADPLYQQYRNQYAALGNQAMRDTMGQAAALTGGYGSSYASTAGNQAYQGHLGRLNDVAPQLYQMAMNAYEAQGNRMQNNLSALEQAESQAYGKWQNNVAEWQDERDYWYNKYQDMLSRKESWKG